MKVLRRNKEVSTTKDPPNYRQAGTKSTKKSFLFSSRIGAPVFSKVRQSNAGFSMLEILIAVAILSTGFVTLLGAQSSSFLSSERAERLTTATFLARQRMVEIEIELEKDLEKGKFPRQDVEKKGVFDEPFDDFRWKYTVSKVEIPVVDTGGEGTSALVGSYMKTVMDEISKAVREVKLTVYWGDKDRPEADQPQFDVTTHIVKL